MATLSSSVLTLSDWAKRLDPDGKTAATVNILDQTNEILTDMLFKEGNLPTGEQTSITTGLPTVYYRLTNQGVPKSKSTHAQVVENAAILEARSEVDKDIAELNGNVKQYRLDEAMQFMEAMNQKMATTLFYGSASTPEEFVGFANRYNSLSGTNAQNILNAGGTGGGSVYTSIWLVGWGQRSVCGVFPKGSKAGLIHEDLGIIDAFDSNNYRFRAYADRFQWKNGLVVKDWRYAVRVANVDPTALAALTGTQAVTASTSIIKMMSRAIDRLPSTSGVTPVFYANRTVLSHLRIVGLEKSSSAVTVENALNQFGQNIQTTRFLGIPVRLVDAIVNTEAEVV
jgi:hypothetical protein